jgi:lactoylglutathione lyase
LKADFYNVHHTAINVTNIEKSIRFYGDVLGLKPLFEPQEASGKDLERTTRLKGATLLFTMLQVGDGQTLLELLQFVKPKGRPYTRRHCDVGAPHIAFRVDDIDAACRELKRKGIEFYSAPLRIASGPLKGNAFVYFKDPDGITLELFEV